MNNKKQLKVHSVSYNFIMNAILTMSSFLFPLITFPYVSRVLGAEGYGIINFSSSVVYYFTSVAALGIPTYGIRACAKQRDDKEALSRIVHELLMISSVLVIAAYMVFFACMALIPKFQTNWQVLMVSSLSILLTNIGIPWFYQAIEQYDYITFRNLLFKVLSIALMFLFVKDAEDLLIYATIQVIASVGSNALNLFRLRRYIYLKPLRNYRPLQHLQPTMQFFLLSVATTIYTHLDTVMLGFMSGDTQVGYYSTAVKMKTLLVSLVSALGAVLLPRASYYVQNKKLTEFKRITKLSFNVVLLAAIPLCIYCMLQAKEILLFLAGDAYLPAVPAMIAITPTILLIGLTTITGLQILVPFGKEKHTTLSTVCGALVDLVLNALLIPRLGALGAAIGTLVAELAVLIYQLWILRGNEYLAQDWRNIAKTVISAVIATVLLLITNHFFGFDSAFITLLVTAVVFFGFYGITLIVLKESITKEIIRRVLLRFRKA